MSALLRTRVYESRIHLLNFSVVHERVVAYKSIRISYTIEFQYCTITVTQTHCIPTDMRWISVVGASADTALELHNHVQAYSAHGRADGDDATRS
jgi:hypothetical protein